MIGQSPLRVLIAHAALILGILIVAFPIYYTFVASTQTLQTILKPPLPLLPGDQLWNNYSE
ncbi:MAG: glycerol-3-phosphate transporter, partial [Mesorhizobium sp.]